MQKPIMGGDILNVYCYLRSTVALTRRLAFCVLGTSHREACADADADAVFRTFFFRTNKALGCVALMLSCCRGYFI
jgi:hypothetical protein